MAAVIAEGGDGGSSGDGLVIAIDGGGSKTDVWVVDLDGVVVGRARGAGSSPQLVGLARAVEMIDALVRSALDAVGPGPVLQTCLYLSGLDMPVEIEAFRACVAPLTCATGATGRPPIVDNDVFAMLRVGAAELNAVALVCGTGINCVGVRADGEQVRFPALGTIPGDWAAAGSWASRRCGTRRVRTTVGALRRRSCR